MASDSLLLVFKQDVHGGQKVNFQKRLYYPLW